MPNRPPKFAIFIRRLLSAIPTIVKTIENQTEAITEATKTAKAQQDLQQEMLISLLHGVETRKSENDATADRNYQRHTLLVSWLTLIAIVIYASLVYLQWQEMIGATNAAQDAVHEARLTRQQSQKAFDATVSQFHLDQRAWIGPVDASITWAVGKPLLIAIPIKNTGKTPGTSVTTVASLRAFSPNKLPAFNDLKKPTGHGRLAARSCYLRSHT